MTNVNHLLILFILVYQRSNYQKKLLFYKNNFSSNGDVKHQRILFTQSHFYKDNQRIAQALS